MSGDHSQRLFGAPQTKIVAEKKFEYSLVFLLFIKILMTLLYNLLFVLDIMMQFLFNLSIFFFEKIIAEKCLRSSFEIRFYLFWGNRLWWAEAAVDKALVCFFRLRTEFMKSDHVIEHRPNRPRNLLFAFTFLRAVSLAD